MQKFYRLSVNIVKILTLLLAVFLFIGSFLTTCYAENMETQQVLLRFDNPLWNLLELAGYGLLFACCLSLSGKAGVKFRRGLLVFTLGLILLLGGMLIVFGRTVPAADALSVYNAAAEWILGNKDIIHPTFSYLSYYPQQIGLMAFLELLLRLWNLTGLSAPAWHFVKLVYVCLLCVAVLFQYRSLRYLWPDDWEPVSCCYLILVCCNLPMILYSSFVYGEIPSFAMLSVGLFLLLKLLADCIPAHSVETTSPDDTRVVGTSHALSAVTVFTALGSILFLTLSVMLRKNSLILIMHGKFCCAFLHIVILPRKKFRCCTFLQNHAFAPLLIAQEYTFPGQHHIGQQCHLVDMRLDVIIIVIDMIRSALRGKCQHRKNEHNIFVIVSVAVQTEDMLQDNVSSSNCM